MSNSKTDVLIISDNDSQLIMQEKKLLPLEEKIRIKKQLIKNIKDFFSSQTIGHQFDILVINLTPHNPINELDVIKDAGLDGKELIIIGDQSNVSLLKSAISLGVRDFIDIGDVDQELPLTINKIHHELIQSKNPNRVRKRINVFMNAKGGSGASFIASNFAYALSEKSEKVVLLDLDLQFGALGLNFDTSPIYSISEAAELANELDNISIEAYLSAYTENLKLLLPSQAEVVLPGEIDPGKIKLLINLLKVNYNQIVIDLPRVIDPIASDILDIADNITIVLQQSLVQYRDGRRLINIINKDLGIPLDRVSVIINRYDANNSLNIKDIEEILHHDRVFCVSNDFELVAMASNLGVPLCESAHKSKIAKELKAIAYELGKVEVDSVKNTLFGRLSNLFK